MKQTTFIFIIFLSFHFFMSCDDTSDNSTTTNNTTASNTTVVKDSSKNKTDVNDAITIVEAGLNIANNIIDSKHIKDSIRNSNKDRLWVYKIGSAYDDEELITQAYEKIKDVPHIYIFKKTKHELYLIKDDGYSTQEQLIDSIGSCKKRIAMLTTAIVKPLDLSLECSSKKEPTTTKPIKYKIDKEKKEIECRVCE